MIINWGCHVSVHQNLWIQKQKLRIHYVGHQCCLLSKKVLSSIPDWSLRVLPRARFLQVLWLPRHQKHVYDSFWFILFSCHALSVLKQKILPFPRSLQKASLPWSTTRVFVIIPPEDISVSGGHFSKTYNPVCPRETIRALAGKTNQKTKLILNSTIALVQYRGNFEQVTEPQTSPDEHLVWQLPQSLHESRECVVLQPLSIPKPKRLTFMSDVSRFPTLTLWHVDAQR